MLIICDITYMTAGHINNNNTKMKAFSFLLVQKGNICTYKYFKINLSPKYD